VTKSYDKCRNSSVSIATTTDCTAGVRFPVETRDFSVFHTVQTGSRAHLFSYPMGTRGSFSGIKRPRHKADHAPPYSAEVNNSGAITPHPTCLHGVVLN
jgi:hypothetical protein